MDNFVYILYEVYLFCSKFIRLCVFVKDVILCVLKYFVIVIISGNKEFLLFVIVKVLLWKLSLISFVGLRRFCIRIFGLLYL